MSLRTVLKTVKVIVHLRKISIFISFKGNLLNLIRIQNNYKYKSIIFLVFSVARNCKLLFRFYHRRRSRADPGGGATGSWPHL